MPWVRCCEEATYQARVASLIQELGEDDQLTYKMRPRLELFVFDFPLIGNWSISGHDFWFADLDLEVRFRCDAQFRGIFVGWHNVEVVSIVPAFREKVYVPVP